MPKKICFVFTLLFLIMALACGTQERMRSEDGSSEDPAAGGTYARYIFYDAKPIDIPSEELDRIRREHEEQQSMVDSTHLLNLDTTRSEGAPYLDFHWLWEGSAKGYAEAEHTHDFDEFIGFIGVGAQDNPYGLDSEIEVWLGGEKFMITRSCLIYVPKGLRHCPVRFARIGKPVLFFTGGMATSYSRTATEFNDEHAAERNNEKLISHGVNPEKISPETLKKWDDEGKKRQSTVEGTRLLDLDSVEGAPYIDFVYLWSGDEKGPNHPEHSHEWGEVFGFIGTNRDDVNDLGGEIEFWLGGEKYLFTKSSLVWVPPGLKHCPIQFNRIDRPFILFTLGMTREYTLQGVEEK